MNKLPTYTQDRLAEAEKQLLWLEAKIRCNLKERRQMRRLILDLKRMGEL